MDPTLARMLRAARIITCIVLILLALAAIDLALHQSVDGAILGRWSSSVFVLFLGVVGMTLVSGAALVWLLTGKPEARTEALERVSLALAHPAAYWLISGLTWVFLAAAWNLNLPLWRSLLRLLSLIVVLVSGGLIILGLRSRQEQAVNPESVYRPALIAAVGLIIVQLALGVMFVTGLAIPFDEGTRAYQAVQLIQGWYKPYQADGLPTLYMPFEFYIQGVFQGLFGPSLLVARVSSALIALVGLRVLFSVARREGSKWAGLATLAFLVVCATPIRSWSIGFQFAAVILWLSIILWIAGAQLPGWLRVALTSFFAVVTVLTRHTMAATPLVIAIYFVLTERPRDWILGGALGMVGGALLVLPFWPGILLIPRFWRNYIGFSYPSDITLRSIYLDVSPAVATYFILILASLVLLSLVGLELRKHGWAAAREGLASYRTTVLASALFIANLMVILPTPFGGSSCRSCLAYYLAFIIPLLAFCLGVVIVALWPHIKVAVAKRPGSLIWAFMTAIIIGTGQRAIGPWHLETPSIVVTVNKIQQCLALVLERGDRVFYLAPLHPMIGLPEYYVYPELTWSLPFYLTDSNLGQSEDFFWWYDIDQVAYWLGQDASVAVIDEVVYGSLAERDDNLRILVEETLAADYMLVDEIPVPPSLDSGTIRVYRRVR